MKILSLTILFFVTSFAYAQQAVRVIDDESGEPVPGVLVEVLDNKAKQIDGTITDIDGIARFNLNGKFNVRISHVSYSATTVALAGGEQVVRIKPAVTTLGDVVVTGQYSAQSAEKSVYNVKTVKAATIQDQGSVQLHEVLSKQLNIRVAPDLALGANSMSLQGIPGKNVKILVDGVPLVNRNGNGNDADLSQINMSNIERVEIVEGPMSVNYGANALAGVINLITKTPKKKSYRVGLDFQGETIDNKYGLNDGNTNINLTSAVSLSDKFMVSLNGGATRFGGYHGRYSGREYEWNPKDQLFYDASLWYRSDKHNINYKFEQLGEIINNAGEVQEDYQFSTGITREFAIDSDYISNRTGHQIQADGKLSDYLRYNFVTSYSDFRREVETYKLWLDTNEKIINSGDTTSFQALVSRGTIQNINPNKLINYQLGYDVNIESSQGGRIQDGEKKVMQDFAGFLSFEFNLKNKLTIRPGLRGSYNNTFGGWVTPSVNLKYFVNNIFSISGAYGNGYRAPSLRELYFEFVDSNHTVIGNPDLTPEYSDHFSFILDHKLPLGNGNLNSKLLLFYNDIKDLISFQFDPNDPTYAKYFNLNRLKTVGVNLTESFESRNINIDIGFGVTGRKELDTQIELPDEYFFSPEVSLNINYKEPWSQIKFNAFYKYNGKSSQYLFDANDELLIGTLEGYGLLDFTISRNIIKFTNLTLGAKNILDVTTLTNSASSPNITGGIHTSSSQRSIGYGRSFFFKIAFNINSTNN